MCNPGLVPQHASLLAEPAEGSASATTPKAVSEAFGKKLDNLKGRSAPHFAYYNFCHSDNLAPCVAKEVQLNWSKWIRQTHRWVSVVFTVAVIINGVTVAQGKYNNRLGLSAVAILAVLLFTGLYLFVLPYVNKWRG
jgi:hypothetical protein